LALIYRFAGSSSMKIGELAKISGVTPRTIRYYEELGLIKPSKYSEGGVRLYSELDVLRLKIINNLKNLNFSLEKIERILFANSERENLKVKSENILKGIEEQFYEASKKMENYIEIEEQIELGLNVFKSCMFCDKKPSFFNCSDCQDIPKGELPRVLKSVF
jgi:DNA-binding transcriptional MerR regulator